MQLYAQLVEEVEQRSLRWWFTNEETRAIQEANLPYQRVYSIGEMVNVCFRQPLRGENVKPMSIADIISSMQEQFPEIDVTSSMKIQVGATLKRLGFEQHRLSSGNCYLAVPREVA